VLSILGSERRTIMSPSDNFVAKLVLCFLLIHGIDVLLDYPANDLPDLRQQLHELDRRFIQTDSKFYFIKVDLFLVYLVKLIILSPCPGFHFGHKHC
jgi:hypothetical protein